MKRNKELKNCPELPFLFSIISRSCLPNPWIREIKLKIEGRKRFICCIRNNILDDISVI